METQLAIQLPNAGKLQIRLNQIKQQIQIQLLFLECFTMFFFSRWPQTTALKQKTSTTQWAESACTMHVWVRGAARRYWLIGSRVPPTDVLQGLDPRDSTTIPAPPSPAQLPEDFDVRNICVGIPKVSQTESNVKHNGKRQSAKQRFHVETVKWKELSCEVWEAWSSCDQTEKGFTRPSSGNCLCPAGLLRT